MKTFAAICLIAAIVMVLSCQESAQTQADMEKMAAQITALETKVTEMSAKVDMMMNDYNMHMEQYHKKAPATTTKPATKTPAVKAPTRK